MEGRAGKSTGSTQGLQTPPRPQTEGLGEAGATSTSTPT